MTQQLAASLQYQSDAVVSKILIKNSGGSVTLFAFDKGQSLSEHSTPFEAFLLVLDGTLTVTINKNPNTVSAGEYILLPPNIPHAVDAVTKTKFLLSMVKHL